MRPPSPRLRWAGVSSKVTIVEVGPRDGLQNEHALVTTADKIALIDRLSEAGHQMIEVSSFVSPKRVPQMADAAEVFAGITRRPGVRYTALVPNQQGLARALAAGVSEVAIFAAASETFSRRNINQSIDESLATYAAVCTDAAAAGLRVRGYLSTCFVCPYEGPVDPQRVAEMSARLLELGVYEVAVSDTIGAATPGDVSRVLDTVSAKAPLPQVALHFHDTRGTALANVLAGLDYGVTTFDSSAGGLGGCPFAPGASGNLATEDLLFMLNGLGIDTGVSLDGVAAASRFIATKLDHALPSRYLQAPELPTGPAN
jgi:hydroxymethylglutaryl-CoA lyase